MLPNAVELRNASKQFGRSSKANVVLKNLNMTVPQGVMWVQKKYLLISKDESFAIVFII